MRSGRAPYPRRLRVNPFPALSLGLSLTLTSACTITNTAQQADLLPECQNLTATTQNLPTDVIVGTDVIDTGRFAVTSKSAIGEYTGESGGAVIAVSITREAVIRTFHEPGVESAQRSFPPPCASGPYLLSDGVIAQPASDGLLYLELSSNVEGLPGNLWIFLNRQ